MLKSKGDIVFGVINYILLLAIMVITIYPLYFIIIASVSNAHSVALGEVWFWPKGFNLNAYIDVFKEKSIWTGYLNTIVYTALGTLINLAVTIPCAYALAKKEADWPERNYGYLHFYDVFFRRNGSRISACEKSRYARYHLGYDYPGGGFRV